MTEKKKKNKKPDGQLLAANMTEKKNKKPNRQLLAANREAKKKRKTARANLFSNGNKSLPALQICKGSKSVPDHMDVDQAMTNHFQDEILMDILSRLPVRSLLRFRCVATFWKTLICEPYFTRKHLNHAKYYQNSQKFLLSQKCIKNGIFSMYSCRLPSVQLVEDIQKLDCPSSSKPWNCAIHCGYDGLVILHVIDNIGDRLKLLLWNPSTRESTILPYPEFPVKGIYRLGLGYDSTSGGYKILKICNGADGQAIPNEILALKSGSWRKIDKHPGGISHVLSGMHRLAFVNEAFYWIGALGNKYVVSFSISNEIYKEIPCPEQISSLKDLVYIGVSELEGMLCVYVTLSRPGKGIFKLWALKNDGVKESWNGLFNIEDPCICKVVPHYRFADGDVLFWSMYSQHGGNAYRTSRGLLGLWPQHDTPQNGIAFTESLISPTSLI